MIEDIAFDFKTAGFHEFVRLATERIEAKQANLYKAALKGANVQVEAARIDGMLEILAIPAELVNLHKDRQLKQEALAHAATLEDADDKY